MDDGLTVVMGHFYTRTRFLGFLRNVLTYCGYGGIGVKRIIVVWHNKRIKPPTMATCPDQGVGGTTVHFLTPAVADTLSNRFTPTYRVRTDIVVTVDDDIIVTERDLARMAAVMRAQGLRRVVSPFPRWHDAKGNYLWQPDISHLRPAAFVGYPFVLTKLHLSYYQLCECLVSSFHRGFLPRLRLHAPLPWSGWWLTSWLCLQHSVDCRRRLLLQASVR